MDASIDKDLKACLNRFKIVLSDVEIYSAHHQIFLQSLEEFKRLLEVIFVVHHSLEIAAAPKYIVVNSVKLEKDPLYVRLANFLHHRTIKNLRIDPGATLEELKFLVEKLSMNPKEVLRQGGAHNLFKKGALAHISVEVLDYTEMLKSTQEDMDIWNYLLNQSVDEKNPELLAGMMKNFSSKIKKMPIKEIMSSVEARESLGKFLTYLEKNDYEAFQAGLSSLLESIIAQGQRPNELALPANFKMLISSLEPIDLAEVIIKRWGASQGDEHAFVDWYDVLFEEKIHETIAFCINKKIESHLAVQLNLKRLKVIYEQLKNHPGRWSQKYYVPVLSGWVDLLSKAEIFHYDSSEFKPRYHEALLSLLFIEESMESVDKIIDFIIFELESSENSDEEKIHLLQRVCRIFQTSKTTESAAHLALQRLRVFVGKFIDQWILEGKKTPEIDYFIEVFSRGGQNSQAYLDKFFSEREPNPVILRMFLKFFPQEVAKLIEGIHDKLSDQHFLLKLIMLLSRSEDKVAFEIYKAIFQSSSAYVKMEVLKEMEQLQDHDFPFLLKVLSDKYLSSTIREQCLHNLSKDPGSRIDAVRVLLSDAGPYWRSKSELIENIRMIGRQRMKEATTQLNYIKNRRVFWFNWHESNEAALVLERWRDG